VKTPKNKENTGSIAKNRKRVIKNPQPEVVGTEKIKSTNSGKTIMTLAESDTNFLNSLLIVALSFCYIGYQITFQSDQTVKFQDITAAC
jgi:hypothetical protein